MSERGYTPEQDADGKTCQWCQGSGYVTRVLAYNPGVDPFKGPTESVHRAGQCKHCRGTGTYDSHLDPTLEHWRRARPDS
ncbi:hypothetical protein [Streptomyces sp. NPDC003077]|uniref:hypothetical protein n=1 Tax=Streptomyces sp. NPDC003077 TaxID=3154443 RepID=UPI0033B1A1E5